MVDANAFMERLGSVAAQFTLARHMVSTFSENQDNVVVAAKEQSDELRKLIERLADLDAPSDVVQRGARLIEEYESQLPSMIARQMADVSNRLNQNELLLVVSLFESQMKNIHREILKQEPELLKPDRAVPLGRLLSLGLDAMIGEEIEREVQSLDRKNVKDRSIYFKDRLGVDWLNETVVPSVEGILELRNAILHNDPDRSVSANDVQEAKLVAIALPMYCCLRASERFPEAFPGFLQQPS